MDEVTLNGWSAAVGVASAVVALISAVEVWLLPARRRRKQEHFSALAAEETNPVHRESLLAHRASWVALQVGADFVPAWRFILSLSALAYGMVVLIWSVEPHPVDENGASMDWSYAGIGAALIFGGLYRATTVYVRRLQAAQRYLDGRSAVVGRPDVDGLHPALRWQFIAALGALIFGSWLVGVSIVALRDPERFSTWSRIIGLVVIVAPLIATLGWYIGGLQRAVLKPFVPRRRKGGTPRSGGPPHR